MKQPAIKLSVVLAFGVSIAALGCEKGGGSIKVDGSSTVFPIMSAVAKRFQKTEGVQIAVAVSGTGGGFKKFCVGETDISDASRPINATEVELCKKNGIEFIELPVAYDGLSVLVNPKNTWAESITVAELKKMWEPEAEGKIKKWSQVREGWPDKELHLYGAGVDSGTYDYFTEAVVQKEHSSRMDFTSSEDDNVLVNAVAGDELALGFFGYEYYVQSQQRLRALAVDDGNPKNGDGPVLPSAQTVRNATYQPLSRPIFIYVAKQSLDRPEVAAFVNFYFERGWRLVEQVGYISLPANAYGLALERVSSRRSGSLFGGKGSQVGVTVDQLLHKEWNDQAK